MEGHVAGEMSQEFQHYRFDRVVVLLQLAVLFRGVQVRDVAEPCSPAFGSPLKVLSLSQ